MMDLDEMRTLWTQHNEKLDESIRLNRALLSASRLRSAKSALARTASSLWLGAAVWLAIVIALGNFVYQESGLQFVLPAVLLDLYAVGMLAANVRQLARIRQIEFGGEVATVQLQLEMLRVLRIRITRGALLAGAIVWAPFAIVIARVVLGIETYSLPWLCANLAFGLLLIPLVYWVSNRFGDRLHGSPFLQRLMKDIAGQNLEDARAFLADLSAMRE